MNAKKPSYSGRLRSRTILIFSNYGPQGHTSLQIAVGDKVHTVKPKRMGRVYHQPSRTAERTLRCPGDSRGHAFPNASNLASRIGRKGCLIDILY